MQVAYVAGPRPEPHRTGPSGCLDKPQKGFEAHWRNGAVDLYLQTRSFLRMRVGRLPMGARARAPEPMFACL